MAIAKASHPFAAACCKALGLKNVRSLTIRMDMGKPIEVEATFYPDGAALAKVVADPAAWPPLQTKQASGE